MRYESSGRKRKAAASEPDVPAKRSASVLVPEEEATMLRTVASLRYGALNAAMLDLVGLPYTDIVARGRAVAVMAKSERKLNIVLGIKRWVSQVYFARDGQP